MKTLLPALAVAAVLLAIFLLTDAPKCDATSLSGPRVAGAILIEGCP